MKMLKKMIATLLIALMVFASAAALAEGKIKTTGNVNVRAGAGLDFHAKDAVSKGKVLTYDKTAKDERGVKWYHVTGSLKGWVSSKYAKVVKDSTPATKGDAVKATGNVNLRKGPGLGYKDIGTLKKGKTAAFLGETKKDARGVKWFKVKLGGKTGWVSSKYAKII